MNLLVARHSPPVPAQAFNVLVEMVAVAEGGIVPIHDSSHATAINNALYGVPIAGQARIVYDKMTGFKIVNK